jgi:hypothetical protein
LIEPLTEQGPTKFAQFFARMSRICADADELGFQSTMKEAELTISTICTLQLTLQPAESEHPLILAYVVMVPGFGTGGFWR